MPDTFIPGVTPVGSNPAPANPAPAGDPAAEARAAVAAALARDATARAEAEASARKAAEAPSTTTPESTFSTSTGDATFDLAVAATAKAYNITPELFASAIQPALSTGNLNALDRVTLIARIGAEGASQVEALTKARLASVQANTEKAVSVVHALAQGKENWTAAVATFNQTAPDFLKSALQGMLTSGDPAKIDYAAREILSRAQQAGALKLGALPVGIGGVSTSTAGLSEVEFRAALVALRKDAGNNSLESGPFGDRYQNLLASRRIGKTAGK